MNKHIPAAAAGIVLAGLALGSSAGTASAAGTAGTRDVTFGSGGIVTPASPRPPSAPAREEAWPASCPAAVS